MNRIETIFSEHRAAGKRALMPFLCGGSPSLSATTQSLLAVQRAGAAIAEVGIPFSDPIADGPVIAAAMHEALRRGVTPAQVLEAVRAARAGGCDKLGTVAMVSVSIVHRIGQERFTQDAAAAGIDGLIVPDVPVEESVELSAIARDHGLTLSLLIAPTTPPERAERIARACTGFVYLLARVGVTGAVGPGSGGPDVGALRERVRFLRSVSSLPIACGFGITTAEDVRLVVGPADKGGAGADAAIVGSALVKRMSRSGAEAPYEAEAFVRALAAGL